MEQKNISEILELYGNESQWRNYEQSIKNLNFMANYNKV